MKNRRLKHISNAYIGFKRDTVVYCQAQWSPWLVAFVLQCQETLVTLVAYVQDQSGVVNQNFHRELDLNASLPWL